MQKTAYEMRISDWSSDVCSSDLERDLRLYALAMTVERKLGFLPAIAGRHRHPVDPAESARQPGIASREQIAIVTILLDPELRDRAQRLLLRAGRARRVVRRMNQRVLGQIAQ